MSVLTFIESHKPRVLDQIQLLIAQTISTIAMKELEYHEYLNSLAHFATSGKCIRGGLFLYSAQLFDAKLTEDHFAVAAALELMHAALLIHDDCMDDDRIRRGAPTLFEKFAQKGKTLHISDPDAYGKNVAICIGDIALLIASDALMRTSVFSPTQKLEMYSYLNTKLIQTCVAQIHDVKNGMTPGETHSNQIEAVNIYKTACYTFQLPLVLGYMSSTDPLLQSTKMTLEHLGTHVGLLYQLRDDYIGLMVDQSESGKQPGGDIRENKKTYLRCVLIQHVTQEERGVLTTLLGNKKISPEQIQWVRSQFTSSGAESTYISSLDYHVNKSQAYTQLLPISKLQKSSILEFISTLRDRTK